MIISITGTPGSGKTYIAKNLIKASGSRLKYFDLNKHIQDKKLYESYDKDAETYDIEINIMKYKVEPLLEKYHSQDITADKLIGKKLDLKKLLDIVSKNKNIKGIIVDSHLSHYIDSDYCIAVRSDIKDIYKRLKARKYPKKKIDTNIQSEIFEICLDEARNIKDNVIIVYN